MGKQSGSTRGARGGAGSIGGGSSISNIHGASDVRWNTDSTVINGITIPGAREIASAASAAGISVDDVITKTQKELISKNPSFAKQVDKMGFEDRGGGVWAIDTKIGGGQVELEESYLGTKDYVAHSWNATYNSWEDKRFGTLNSAKQYIKSKIKGN